MYSSCSSLIPTTGRHVQDFFAVMWHYGAELGTDMLYTWGNSLFLISRAKERAVRDAENQKQLERQAQFESLPEWKKKLIRQQKHS